MWPQDPQFPRALAGGVTTIQVLPGSANLIGGRSVVLKVVPVAHRAGDEVPRRAVRPEDGVRREPEARLRAARPVDAHGQRRRLSRGLDPGRAVPPQVGQVERRHRQGRARPTRDLALETLAEVLRGNILVHNHCYRADEMAQMIDIAKEFGYKIRSFHHGVEATRSPTCWRRTASRASIWADWGGFKMEALDGVQANVAILQRGRRARDHPLGRPVGIAAAEPGSRQGDGRRRRHRHADRARTRRSSGSRSTRRGRSASTTASARSRPGKNADVVLWSGDPFSVYTRAEKVWIDGALLFDRIDAGHAVAHRLRARLRAARRPADAAPDHVRPAGARRRRRHAAGPRRGAADRHRRRQGLPGLRPGDRERHRRHRRRPHHRRRRHVPLPVGARASTPRASG